jgi:hypothetical protein
MTRAFALLFASSLLAAGCAAPDMNAGEPTTDKVYRTGSNIPERERGGVTTVSVEEFERQRAANSGTLVRDPARRSGP